MKFLITFLFITAFTFSAISQKADVINAAQLQQMYKTENDTTYVVNFWATWCKPCIEELPYFLQLEKELNEEKVKFLFISLDDSKYKESRVIPFIEKHNMNYVFILEDNDPNDWIPQISEEWTGSIPATLISKNNKTTFHETKLNYEQLSELVKNKKGAQ